jgi:hypothetical protein
VSPRETPSTHAACQYANADCGYYSYRIDIPNHAREVTQRHTKSYCQHHFEEQNQDEGVYDLIDDR